MRIAWFSPVPPDPSGIAAYTAEIVPLIESRKEAIDLFTEQPRDLPGGRQTLSAQEFVWRQRQRPYDLTVYQMGNAACHDYMWAYLFRYPGLLVLHDAQLHQARALGLLRRLEPRLDDYLAELAANHPNAPEDVGHLITAGLGGTLFRLWPLVSLAVLASRLAAVHNHHLAARLAAHHRQAAVVALPMGVADPLHGLRADARTQVRARFGIPGDAVVVGAFGGMTPEKRIPQLLEARSRLGERLGGVHVLLVGRSADHYDVQSDVHARGLDRLVHIAGHVADEDLPAYLAAVDLCACLRWPTNHETSASWLRCLAAGQATVTTALADLRDVPALAALPESERLEGDERTAVTVSVDPYDEPMALPLALEALSASRERRSTLGANARRYWQDHHTLAHMADAYEDLIARALARPAPALDLPPHLLDEGTGTLSQVMASFGLSEARFTPFS
jgi:glycosyltransferase involved in cell wall biosynthesis